MKLLPKQVLFVKPFFSLSFSSQPPLFVGKEKNVQLRETAFVIEAKMLKVRFLGIEGFFQRAITELTSLTIPYQRMVSTRYVRWPLSRLIFGLLLLLLPALAVMVGLNIPYNAASEGVLDFIYSICVVGWALSLYFFFRIPSRYVFVYQTRGNRRCSIMMKIKPAAVRKEFERRLRQYVESAKLYQTKPSQSQDKT